MAVSKVVLGFQKFRSVLRVPGIVRDFSLAPNRRKNTASDRFELNWVAGQRGKPSLNADIQNAAEATRMIADPDFEVLGTNMTSALSTFAAEGGITITTAGADADQAILCPHLDANQSAWTQVTWGTDRYTEWECEFATGAAITASIVWAGLKLTNTPTAVTDNDQIYIRYQNAVTSGRWVLWTSIGGTDTSTDTGITVALSTTYRLKIRIDSARLATVYMSTGASPVAGSGERAPDWTKIYTTTALTDTTDLIPYIGVQASGAAAAKAITVYSESISRAKA